MRPKKHESEGSEDLFRARLDQIIDMKHGTVRLSQEIDWDWLDGELADCFSDKGRPGVASTPSSPPPATTSASSSGG